MPAALNPQQEQELLNKAKKDLVAFREIYACYFPRVYAYVGYRVGRVQDTEDVVSAVFLKAIERLDSFEWRGAGSFTGWLFRIAHDLVVDYYRQHLNDQAVLPIDNLPNLAQSILLPEDEVLQKEKFARLQALISTLSSRRKEIITLRFYGRLRNNEIAQVLGLDERTVASHLCRGLEDLHRLYINEFVQRDEFTQSE